MIESFNFGQMIIDNQKYSKDLIIYPDHIDSSWWRKEGHNVYLEDIKEVLEKKPEVFIVGTGKYGLMKISKEVKETLAFLKIKLIAEKTDEACEMYNKLYQEKKVIAAFHLTC
jgi:hypothetical protein